MEFTKGERGLKSEFFKYYDELRVKCFEEGNEKKKDEDNENENTEETEKIEEEKNWKQ